MVSPFTQVLKENRPAKKPRARFSVVGSGKRMMTITKSYLGFPIDAMQTVLRVLLLQPKYAVVITIHDVQRVIVNPHAVRFVEGCRQRIAACAGRAFLARAGQ